MTTFRVGHLFSGVGGGELGFQRAIIRHRGKPVARFETAFAVDFWAEACAASERLTGAPATQMDLVYPDDYLALHGSPPPPGWTPVTARDLYLLSPDPPDVIFLSPPCKAFSGLLSAARSREPKYQAMARLARRGIELACAAWDGRVPLILLENVPGIRHRGASLLDEMRVELRRWGYVLDDRDHDAGRMAGLSQSRMRFLLVARQPNRCAVPLHRPVEHPLTGIGNTLSRLAPPWTTAGSRLPRHQLPKCQWQTWLRLALISPGADWRALEKVDAYVVRRRPDGVFIVAAQIDGVEISPPGWSDDFEYIGHWGRVDRQWMNGTRFDSGFRVRSWGEHVGALETSNASASGAPYVADPRLSSKDSRHTSHMHNTPWSSPSRTVTGATHVGNGSPVASDPRLTCTPRGGSYGMIEWSEPAPTIAASIDIHAGRAAVADPRIQLRPTDRCTPLVISPWGTFNRPLTTCEISALQGFTPDEVARAFGDLSDEKVRQMVGNAVPVASAEKIAEEFGTSLAESAGRLPIRFSFPRSRWVAPNRGSEHWRLRSGLRARTGGPS